MTRIRMRHILVEFEKYTFYAKNRSGHPSDRTIARDVPGTQIASPSDVLTIRKTGGHTAE